MGQALSFEEYPCCEPTGGAESAPLCRTAHVRVPARGQEWESNPCILPARRSAAHLVLSLVEPLHVSHHVSARRLQRVSTSLFYLPLSLSCGCSFLPTRLPPHSPPPPTCASLSSSPAPSVSVSVSISVSVSVSLSLSLSLSHFRERGFQCRVRQHKAQRVAGFRV
jgi:hypothetical protein